MFRLLDLFAPRKPKGRRAARPRPAEPTVPVARRVALDTARETGDWTRVRTPSTLQDERPTDLTLAWAARLPPRTRPQALLAKYPRVANRLALCWADRGLTETLLDGLLVDKRGTRKGFPLDVGLEIKVLYDLHHTLGGDGVGSDSHWAANAIAVGDR